MKNMNKSHIKKYSSVYKLVGDLYEESKSPIIYSRVVYRDENVKVVYVTIYFLKTQETFRYKDSKELLGDSYRLIGHAKSIV